MTRRALSPLHPHGANGVQSNIHIVRSLVIGNDRAWA